MSSSDWLIWQLIDSAFPTGGFAHSSGLESAYQAGRVRQESQLAQYVRSSLRQAGQAALPYVAATHGDALECWVADQHCDAFLANPVVNRASRAQGSGLLSVACKAFPQQTLKTLRQQARSEQHAQHYAPVFGVTFSQLGISLPDTVNAFLFLTIRDLLSAAIRLNIVGPMRAQWLQNELSSDAQHIAASGFPLDYRSAVVVAPMIEMWQSSHDRLYSRLFQS